jgi:Acyltransferase C-terminus
VHIKRAPIDEVPVDEDEFSHWLMDQFTAKDRYSIFSGASIALTFLFTVCL